MPSIRTAKRKEQSRSAAKCRRLTETEIYAELGNTLLVDGQETIYQSDRIGLLRLATMMFRTRRLMARLFPTGEKKCNESYFDESTLSKCLCGFILIVNKSGQLIYVSSSASTSIGFTQVDLMGKYFRDYVHADDWHSLCEQLRVKESDTTTSSGDKREPEASGKPFFRMKTAMTPRGGRARKLTMAVYQPVQAHIIDPTRKMQVPSFDSKSSSADEDIRILLCVPFLLSPLQKPIASSMLSGVASSRHELNMRFLFCNDKLANALEHSSSKQMIGRSFYELVYPEDILRLDKEIRQVYKHGHVTTSYYRLSTKSGGYVWAMTEAALLVQNIRGVTQSSILCNHCILSNAKNNMSSTVDYLPSCSSSVIVSSSGSLPPQHPVKHAEHDDDTAPRKSPPRIVAPPSQSTPAGQEQDQRNLANLAAEQAIIQTARKNADNYALLCLSGAAAAQPVELNSLLAAAAMTPSAQFAGSVYHAAAAAASVNPFSFPPFPVYCFDRANLCSSIFSRGTTDFGRMIVNAAAAAAAATAGSCAPSPYQPRSVIVGPTSGHMAVLNDEREERRRRLDAKTIESFENVTRIGTAVNDRPAGAAAPAADDTQRRNRLDAKTIEDFELAMIKNELTVCNE